MSLPAQCGMIDKPVDKLPIKRLNSDVSDSAHMLKIKAPAAKKTRVEHVVIEKRYRMKITDSLNELKRLLPCNEESKVQYIQLLSNLCIFHYSLSFLPL